MRKHVSALRAVVGGTGLVLTLGFLLPACGGGGSSPTPVPTPTPRVRTVIGSSNFQLLSPSDAQARGLTVDFAVLPFTLGSTGDVDVTVDWTFSSNDIDVALLRGNCNVQAVLNRSCATIVESTSATAKPERLSSAGLGAGDYTVLIANFGPGAEAGNVVIGVTR